MPPLDVAGREDERERAGKSAASAHRIRATTGRAPQWAFPIDAADAGQAFRPTGCRSRPRPGTRSIALARDGRVLLPLRPPHTLMTFYTLTANRGRPCSDARPGDLIDPPARA